MDPLIEAMYAQAQRMSPATREMLSEMGDTLDFELVVSGIVLRPAEDYDDPDSDWVFEVTYIPVGHPLVGCASNALHLSFGTSDWGEARTNFISRVKKES